MTRPRLLVGLLLGLVLAGISPLLGCAPTSGELMERRPDPEWAFRVWQARLPSPLWWCAIHLVIEVRSPDDPPGIGETWEVWQSPRGEDGTHVCKNLGTIRGGVGGGDPTLVYELRGERAREPVLWIRQHAREYASRDTYLAWPGPNSNTYVATMLRECPGVRVDLPPTAIGKDWRWLPISTTTTGTGVQLDLLIVGAQVGLREGVEAHFLGTSLGVGLWPPALKLPGVGRVGVQQW